MKDEAISSNSPAPWRFSPLVIPGLYVALVFCIAAIGLYYSTTSAMVSVWLTSETFAHGFLIAPIALWLVWRKRSSLLQQKAQPAWLAAIPLAAAGLLWLLASLASVQVIQQLAWVAILIAGLWLVLGVSVARALAFPLAYLFLAVPLGEGLIPGMMEFTADFTVALLNLTGIPVYREGLVFSIPSGSWSVVEACSGVRYLIASVTLGILYAHVTYQSLSKRLLFILASIVVPILANGLRAYMIVMIGHLSDMKLATGVDHLIYGWMFFGIVILGLFALGAIWADPEPALADHNTVPSAATGTELRALALGLLLAVLLAAVWPVLERVMRTEVSEGAAKISLVQSGTEAWRIYPDTTELWRPAFKGADSEYGAWFERDGETVAAYIGLYWHQRQGSEIVNSGNRLMASELENWRVMHRQTASLELNGMPQRVGEATVGGDGQSLLLWHWYKVGERQTGNAYIAKLFEIYHRITFARADAAMIVVATPLEDNPERARDRLARFASEQWPSLEAATDIAAGQQQ